MTERVITDKTEVPIDELRNLFLDLLERLNLELVETTSPDMSYGIFSLRPKAEDACSCGGGDLSGHDPLCPHAGEKP